MPCLRCLADNQVRRESRQLKSKGEIGTGDMYMEVIAIQMVFKALEMSIT